MLGEGEGETEGEREGEGERETERETDNKGRLPTTDTFIVSLSPPTPSLPPFLSPSLSLFKLSSILLLRDRMCDLRILLC